MLIQRFVFVSAYFSLGWTLKVTIWHSSVNRVSSSRLFSAKYRRILEDNDSFLFTFEAKNTDYACRRQRSSFRPSFHKRISCDTRSRLEARLLPVGPYPGKKPMIFIVRAQKNNHSNFRTINYTWFLETFYKKNIVKTSHKHAWCPCHWQRSAPLFFQRRKHSMSIARSCLRYLYLSIKFSFSPMYLDGDFHRYSFELREVDGVSHPRRRWRRSAEIYFSQFF